MKSRVNYKFYEDKLIRELQEYVDKTYDQHYATDKYQATDVIIDSGHGTGFCLGNVIKYAKRYGNKGSPCDARKDLMKILHYTLIQMYVHDTQNQKEKPQTTTPEDSQSISSWDVVAQTLNSWTPTCPTTLPLIKKDEQYDWSYSIDGLTPDFHQSFVDSLPTESYEEKKPRTTTPEEWAELYAWMSSYKDFHDEPRNSIDDITPEEWNRVPLLYGGLKDE